MLSSLAGRHVRQVNLAFLSPESPQDCPRDSQEEVWFWLCHPSPRRGLITPARSLNPRLSPHQLASRKEVHCAPLFARPGAYLAVAEAGFIRRKVDNWIEQYDPLTGGRGPNRFRRNPPPRGINATRLQQIVFIDSPQQVPPASSPGTSPLADSCSRSPRRNPPQHFPQAIPSAFR
jgi:hypothetical protein